MTVPRPSLILGRSVLWVVLLAPQAGLAQALTADYTVTVSDTASQQFRVRADFRNVRDSVLTLALPTWTPGYYTLEYYAKNVRRFSATDTGGNRLPARLSAIQTWSVSTRGRDRVIVEFDYTADVLAVNQAKLAPTYGFFTGTQLFLEPVGHRKMRARVKFVLPRGWRIATALDETRDSTVYTAPDYDTLVDAPAWVGAVDVHRFEAGGRPHYLAVDPRRRLPGHEVDAYAAKLKRVIETQASIFGGLPYRKYVVFLLPPDEVTGLALEHGNSFVSGDSGDSTLHRGTMLGAAHELFHLWNVKRIRPAELWPYNYARGADTPSLWFSEGVSNYMARITLLRAGLDNEAVFRSGLPRTPSADLGREAMFTSPSDASMAAFRSYLNEPISYYVAGDMLGLILDLSILHHTQGRRRLDDVFRRLWTDFFLRGRGFTPSSLERTVSAVAGRDYADFFRRYVRGTEELPLADAYGHVGMVVRRYEVSGRVAGGLFVADGFRVDDPQASSTVSPPLQAGDVIVATNGKPGVPWEPGGQPAWVRAHVGERVALTVRRGQQQFTATAEVRTVRTPSYALELDPRATDAQLAIRRAWLSTPK